MTSPLFIVVFAMAAFAMASTSGKDAVKNVDLAEELEKARDALAKSHQQSEKLRQDLEKSREETKRIIKKENKKLEKENEKLRRQDEELKRRVYELHQADSEIKRSLRQRDENNTVELQNFVRNSFGFRQMDFNSELEKTINKQIEKYLDEHRMCVSGVIEQSLGGSGQVIKQPKIEFGQTFRRIPTFAAALSQVYLDTSKSYAYAWVYDFHVTNSSAVVTIVGTHCNAAHVNWIACL